ncbi:MAG: hypothetical protein K8W52_07430 [Deltaproteobacteria bacterium]|nr:hypothetical protein [Deltaproteobacteria bacterium]
MPKPFSTWTVLPHRPIEKLADNLWRVSGMMGQVQRQMVVGRMRDGGLLIDNAIALDDAEMKELEAWGRPTFLVVPNGYHRQDAAIWKARYPQLKVIAPPRGRKRVAKVVPVDLTTDEAPGDETVKVVPIAGSASDTLVQIRSGDDVTLVFCDTILNVPKRTGPVGFMLAPTGRVSVPRAARWMMIQDKRALAAQLEELAALPGLRRVLVGHGAPITADPAGALRSVVEQLRA